MTTTPGYSPRRRVPRSDELAAQLEVELSHRLDVPVPERVARLAGLDPAEPFARYAQRDEALRHRLDTPSLGSGGVVRRRAQARPYLVLLLALLGIVFLVALAASWVLQGPVADRWGSVAAFATFGMAVVVAVLRVVDRSFGRVRGRERDDRPWSR